VAGHGGDRAHQAEQRDAAERRPPVPHRGHPDHPGVGGEQHRGAGDQGGLVVHAEDRDAEVLDRRRDQVDDHTADGE
jgi:hypothetical protein